MNAVSFRAMIHRVPRLPFFACFLIAIALQFTGEWFPFSRFPMYSGFSKETSVLYLSDGKDELVPVNGYFRLSSAKLKKIYNTELDKICAQNGHGDSSATAAELRAAGQKTIAYLMTQTRENSTKKIEAKGLRLHRTKLLMVRSGEDKGFHRDTVLVGEWQP